MNRKKFLLFALFMGVIFDMAELVNPIKVSEAKAEENGESNTQRVSFHQGKYDMIMFSVPSSGGMAKLNDEKGGSFKVKNMDDSLIANNKKVYVSLRSDNGWNVVRDDESGNNKLGYSLLLLVPVNNKTTFWLTPDFAIGKDNEVINQFAPDKTIVEKGKKVTKPHREIYEYVVDGKVLNNSEDGVTVNYRAMAKPNDLSDASIREGDYSDVIRYSFEVK